MRAAWPLLAALAAPAASAQQQVDPAVAHFRDYRAALERDDLPAAETAAAAALAASETAAGNRTAVLALNLANLRLELGGDYDALPAARTAHRLATSAADSGIDPTAAALTLGRAELAAGDPAGAPRLLEALAAADRERALETDAYNAAVALGTWASENTDAADTARTAWGTAARLAHTTDDPALARARALTNQGLVIARAAMDRAAHGSSGRARTLSPVDAKAASDAFSIAQRLLRDRALADAPRVEGPTPAQQVYAQALAWQTALLARVESAGQPPPLPLPLDSDGPPPDDGDRCALRVLRGGAELDYPAEALDRYGAGAVVVQLGVNAGGAATGSTIAAAVPPGTLAQAVAAVMHDWRTEKDPSAAPTCRMPGSVFVPVRFVLEDRS
jgi:hypothetical protein